MTRQPSESAPALVVQGISKSYGQTRALASVDLVVPKGTVTAILGPSGCGKTTLLRIVAGFERPDTGQVEIDGQPVVSGRRWVHPERRGIGYVAQEGALFPHLTVARNVAFGLPWSQRRGGRVGELLEMVSLDPGLGRRYPHQLSGGQQQRVALARALARRPALVLLDEPYSSLDTGLRVSTREAVMAALAEAGLTTLLVTHDHDEALSLADQVAVLRDGLVAQVGSPRDVYERPADLATAAMVGEVVTLTGEATGSTVHCSLGEVPIDGPETTGPVTIMLRPSQLRVVAGTQAVVTRSDYFGSDLMITAQLTGAPVPPLRVRLDPSTTDAGVGSTVGLAIIGAVRVFAAVAGPAATEVAESVDARSGS